MKALCLRALPPSRVQVKLSSAASVRSTSHSRHGDGSPGVRLRATSGAHMSVNLMATIGKRYASTNRLTIIDCQPVSR